MGGRNGIPLYDDPRGLRKGRGGGGLTKVLALLLAFSLVWGWRSHRKLAANEELVRQTKAMQEKWKGERLDQKKRYDGLNQKMVTTQSQLRVTKIECSRTEHRLSECEKKNVESDRFMEEGVRERQVEKLTQDLGISRMATQECEGKLFRAEQERNDLDKHDHDARTEIKQLQVEIGVLQLELQKYRPEMNVTVTEEDVQQAIYELEHPEEAEAIEQGKGGGGAGHSEEDDEHQGEEGEGEHGAEGEHGEEGEHSEEGEHGDEGEHEEETEEEPAKARAARPKKVTKSSHNKAKAKTNWKRAKKKTMKPPSL